MGRLSDLKASELISRSVSGVITDAEKEELDEYFGESDPEQAEAAQSFAKLSQLIAKSAVLSQRELEEANSGKETVKEQGLSEVSKERMRRSIRTQLSKSTTGSYHRSPDALGVAELDSPYEVSEPRSDSEGIGQFEEPPEECRQAVSRFTLLQKIGEGGLGTVWLARDELLHRNVALKEMTAEAAKSRRQWHRFQREAEITGHLEHPNVVPLYMSGVNPANGRPFYAMRFLGKKTLAEAIKEHHAKTAAGLDDPIDLHRLLNSFVKVCQAIAYAHSRGVIHRDLKPDNVILDNFGQVVVLDWGLAKMESEGELALRLRMTSNLSDSRLGHTIEGDIVGTPLYMPPEQAAGDTENIDARTDIYGLGAILFAILTGHAPHEHSNVKSDGQLNVKDFLESIVLSDTPSARAINPSIPKDLEAICMRAMAKEKFARHADATELAVDVERWIAGKNEQEGRYDAMRMAGRDLKSRLCVQMRQLASVTLFMMELPPIQGIIQSVDGDPDEYAVWRERLSQILLALTKVRPNLSGTSYARVDEDRTKEIVRIERSLLDVSNVRHVPQSRLQETVANTFQITAMEQFPGECSMTFDCTASGAVRVICGAPVFDDRKEEPFGLVSADAEIGNLVRPELDMAGTKEEVFLIDDSGSILFSSSRTLVPKGSLANEVIEQWDEIHKTIKVQSEFLDPDLEHYATRLPFPGNQQAINIVLRSKR